MSFVVLLLILTTVVAISIVLCTLNGTSRLVLLLRLLFCVFVGVTRIEVDFFSFLSWSGRNFFDQTRILVIVVDNRDRFCASF